MGPEKGGRWSIVGNSHSWISRFPESVQTKGRPGGVRSRLVTGEPLNAVPALGHVGDPQHLAQSIEVLPGNVALAKRVQLVEEIGDVLLEVGRHLHTDQRVFEMRWDPRAVQVPEMPADGRVEEMAGLVRSLSNFGSQDHLWWGGQGFCVLRRWWNPKGRWDR